MSCFRTCAAVLMALWPLCVAAGDSVIGLASDDPVMSAAAREAQATLPRFMTRLSSDPWLAKTAFLKVALPVTVGNTGATDEVIWVTGFRETAPGRFQGKLAREPDHLMGLSAGSTVGFATTQIRDWAAVIDGRGYGYYTLRAMLPVIKAEEAVELRDFLAPEPVPAGW